MSPTGRDLWEWLGGDAGLQMAEGLSRKGYEDDVVYRSALYLLHEVGHAVAIKDRFGAVLHDITTVPGGMQIRFEYPELKSKHAPDLAVIAFAGVAAEAIVGEHSDPSSTDWKTALHLLEPLGLPVAQEARFLLKAKAVAGLLLIRDWSEVERVFKHWIATNRLPDDYLSPKVKAPVASSGMSRNHVFSRRSRERFLVDGRELPDDLPPAERDMVVRRAKVVEWSAA